MQPNVRGRARRSHGAEIKTKVLAECGQPGASVSAVALAHGLNANLVRSWMRGRGLRRAGVTVGDGSGGEATRAALAAQPAPRPVEGVARLQFVPMEIAAQSKSIEIPAGAGPADGAIEVELRRGSSHVTVRWPTSQAARCAQWLRELTAAVLK